MEGRRELEPVGGVHSGEERIGDREPAALLAALKRGDADAFEAVAADQAPRLYRLAFRLCGNREDAEDLVQETLVRSLPKLAGFEGRARLSTYLIRALTNLWKNRLRSKSRSRLVAWFRGGRAAGRSEADGELPEFDPPSSTPSAQEGLEARERASRVRAAVSRLEPTRRLTLLLREVEEMSYEEIAEMTGVPVGTVRSRLARARDDLRGMLGAER